MTEYDIFINAAGSSPDSSFLMNSCLKTDSGFINCDENFQTADSNIYAIGDVSVSNNLNNQHWAYAQVRTESLSVLTSSTAPPNPIFVENASMLHFIDFAVVSVCKNGDANFFL